MALFWAACRLSIALLTFVVLLFSCFRSSLDRYIRNLIAACDLAQQLPEHRLLLGTEAGEKPLVIPVGNLPELGKDAASLLRQRENLTAVVRFQRLSREPFLVF